MLFDEPKEQVQQKSFSISRRLSQEPQKISIHQRKEKSVMLPILSNNKTLYSIENLNKVSISGQKEIFK